MTFMKRFTLATLVAGFSGAIGTPSYAFMVGADVVETAAGSADMTTTVGALRQELKAGQTKCSDMLVKIDAAIETIDVALDAGIADEKKYMGLRDELVELRLMLPCTANELTAGEMPLGGVPVDGVVIDQGAVAGDAVIIEDGGFANSGYGGMSSAGGTSMSGGAGGAAGSGGGRGAGGLLALGALATAISLGVDDDDSPGDNASPSD